MAKLTKNEVLHVAKLARLKLTGNDIKKFSPQLSSVVDFISQLNAVDTKNIEPTSQTTGLINIVREDKMTSDGSLTNDQALSGTDETYNKYFKVPAILSERSDK